MARSKQVAGKSAGRQKIAKQSARTTKATVKKARTSKSQGYGKFELEDANAGNKTTLNSLSSAVVQSPRSVRGSYDQAPNFATHANILAGAQNDSITACIHVGRIPARTLTVLEKWVSPPHEDASGPDDFLLDMRDGMAAAAILLQEDDVPMPWEYDICQYHKHEVTAECERKHFQIASVWEFDEGPSDLQVQQPRRSPRCTNGAQAPSYADKTSGKKLEKNPPKLPTTVRGKLKAVKRSKTG